MKNKELLLEAIDNYNLYTRGQRALLKTLININIDNIATANVSELSELSGMTKPLIYNSLGFLEREEIIEKIKGPNRGIAMFKLKPAKLEEIERIFLKKRDLAK